MLGSLSRIRKALVAGMGAGGTVYASLAAVGALAWWIPLAISAVAAVAVGGVTWAVPNAPAPITS
jgi:hypothetical protein